jgi:hypothetical protein
MNNKFIILTLLLAAIAIGVLVLKPAQTDSLTLRFQPVVGTQPLVVDGTDYANPVGEGRFSVRNLRFFISNIELVADSYHHRVENSYHLLKFSQTANQHQLTLTDIPSHPYHSLILNIGVDEQANHSIQLRGDLDPNSQMAWSWDAGYKFLVLEGGLVNDQQFTPLVYHVGFSENLRSLQFALDSRHLQEGVLTLSLDIEQLFDGVHKLDPVQLPGIKFDREDARRMADNYAAMFRLVE